MSEQHLGYIYRSVKSMQNVLTLDAFGMIACGYSSGQTCQKQKKPACRSVATQIAHFVQRESFHALDYVVLHCDNSATLICFSQSQYSIFHIKSSRMTKRALKNIMC